MTNYQRLNNLTGWVVFAIATATYVFTLEPTVSFWDCGEFISGCYKLQVVHPPGASLFLLIGRLFALAAPAPDKVAFMVNLMSALCSSFSILFLFWSITALARKALPKNKDATQHTQAQTIAIMGSGVVGALAYTFSDSFWFSAAEAEVYAMSSLFTAAVFWAILKWENVADQPRANRWLVLIAYLMGLSIGVHLLNLLAIPAIAYVYYYKKYKPTWAGFIATGGISLAILGAIQIGVIQTIPTIAAKFELLFKNSFGLPFGYGATVFIVIFIIAVVAGVYYSEIKQKVLLNTVLLSLSFVLVGYATSCIVMIRSASNTSIDMNNPEDIYSLLSYVKREQYGDVPLLKGPYFTAEAVSQEASGNMRYRKGADKYEEVGKDLETTYNKEVLFPRAYAAGIINDSHIQFYRRWLDVPEGSEMTGGKNLNFLFTYQLGHMWFRYFMWNFVGRQNDEQSNGREYDKGNWVSGFSFIDETMTGPQQGLPATKAATKARNVYYMLPLILGILGLVYQYKKSRHDWNVVLFLFILTGIAINIYLNPSPIQPRERDYAYVGSFYAFAIWIGLGVLAVYEFLNKKINANTAAIAGTALCTAAVPALMLQQNYDDHNRSGKTNARDFAYNYLQSCAPNAILFTMGDNDTYPLWYAQEVEGIRRDIRIVNLSLLGTDWYINQMRQNKLNGEAEGAGFTINNAKIVQGTRDYLPFVDRKLEGFQDLRQVIDFMTSDSQDAKVPLQNGESINYLPTQKVKLSVNKAAAIANGTVTAADTARIVSELQWNIPRGAILKSDLMVLDLIAQNNWRRPIYFTVSMGPEQYLGMQKYFQLDGLCYRLAPIEVPDAEQKQAIGNVNTEVMYDNMMRKFRWGNMAAQGAYLDPETIRMTYNLRTNMTRLSESLVQKGDKKRAAEVLDKCFEVMPPANVPYSVLNFRMVRDYFAANQPAKAQALSKNLFAAFEEESKYYTSLPAKYFDYYQQDNSNALYVMQDLVNTNQELGDKKFAETLKVRFETVIKNMQSKGLSLQ
jgi:hypothetical protein